MNREFDVTVVFHMEDAGDDEGAVERVRELLRLFFFDYKAQVVEFAIRGARPHDRGSFIP